MKCVAPRFRNRAMNGMAVMLTLLAGCGIEVTGNPNPIEALYISVWTPERETHRHLLVTGEEGDVFAAAYRRGPFGGLTVANDVRVTFSSANGAVLGVQQTDGMRARIRGLGPGSTSITVEADGTSASARVDVVAEPLPITSLIVRLAPVYEQTEAEYDDAGSLTSVTLSAGDSVVLSLRVERNGVTIFEIPFTGSSAAPEITSYAIRCSHSVLGGPCAGYSLNSVVTAVSPGQTTITITVRNMTRSFLANVR
jgi:hypothetical protein